MSDGILFVRDQFDTAWLEISGGGVQDTYHFDPHALAENVTVPDANTWVFGGPMDLNGFTVTLGTDSRLVIV